MRTYAYSTNIEGLMIFQTENGMDFVPPTQFRAHLPLKKLQMQTHASFVTLDQTLDHHRKSQIIQSELCQLEYEPLTTKLRLMASDTNPYTILDLFGPGHTLVKLGATAYVLQCVEVEVERFNYANCI